MLYDLREERRVTYYLEVTLQFDRYSLMAMRESKRVIYSCVGRQMTCRIPLPLQFVDSLSIAMQRHQLLKTEERLRGRYGL